MADNENPETELEEGNERKLLVNPFRKLLDHRAKKRLEHERMLLLREERMKEDFERFLMEIEERNTWVSYELNSLNYQRMVKREIVAKIAREQAEKDRVEQIERMQENGLSFFKGNIISDKRWQNSAAKHLDIKGHEGAIFACKLSKCKTYILSCSDDRTARLWSLRNGKCVHTFVGHSKNVTDCDFHPSFAANHHLPCIVTCSGDTTIRLWNTLDSSTSAVSVIRGHSQSVYRCAFSPDGNTIVSCSEDKTIRTWCFPEGYLLYIYRGHSSAITSVSFSPTGRYL